MLRGALVLGLAVAVIAAVSSDFMFPRQETRGATRPVILQQSVAEAEGRTQDDPPPQTLDPSLFSPEPSITGALPLVGARAAKTSRQDAGQGSGTTEVPRTASVPVQVATSEPAPTSGPVDAAAPRPAAADPGSPETAMLSGRAFLDSAVPADAQLGETAALPSPPDPQPVPARTTSVRSRGGKRPSGPPPNCGSRHAYWKVAGGNSTWYCR
jgi:hypothetical protein